MKTTYKYLILLLGLLSCYCYSQVKVDSLNLSTTFYGPLNETVAEFTLTNYGRNGNIEGIIEFETNKSAIIYDMYLEIEGDYKQASTLSREKGQLIYNTIVQKKIDPGVLIKITENKYRVKIFPFQKSETRRLIVKYYSILETDTSGLAFWIFNLTNIELVNNCIINLKSTQAKNVELLNSNLIIVGSNNDQHIKKDPTFFIENKILSDKTSKIYFNFNSVKKDIVYYSNNNKLLQPCKTKSYLNLNLNQQKAEYTNISTDQIYPPFLIAELIKEIDQGIRPHIKISGENKFLNSFLSFQAIRDKLVFHKSKTSTFDDYQNIQDDIHWRIKKDKWHYVDNKLVLEQINYKKNNAVKIECPFIEIFFTYLNMLNKSVDEQIKTGLLNSNLSKIVIENNKETTQIWNRIIELDEVDIEFPDMELSNTILEEPSYFVAIEEMPEPIGGTKAVYESLIIPRNFSLTDSFKVYMLAKIQKTGQAIDLKVIKNIKKSIFQNTIIEKLSTLAICLPEWKPGKQRRNNIDCYVSVPIRFIPSLADSNDIINYNEHFYKANIESENRIFLIDSSFNYENSIDVRFLSNEYWNLIIENPEILTLSYKVLFLSKFDGLGTTFIKNSNEYHYMIKNDYSN